MKKLLSLLQYAPHAQYTLTDLKELEEFGFNATKTDWQYLRQLLASTDRFIAHDSLAANAFNKPSDDGGPSKTAQYYDNVKWCIAQYEHKHCAGYNRLREELTEKIASYEGGKQLALDHIAYYTQYPSSVTPGLTAEARHNLRQIEAVLQTLRDRFAILK